MRAMRCCLNPKVIGGLIALGVAIWLLAPAAGAAALPLLIVLVCPLSMGVMMWQMRRTGAGCGASGTSGAASGADVDEQLRQAREELAVERASYRLADESGPRPA